MIDTNLRHQLSQDLRRLVTGRMTNDDFDDAYYEYYVQSGDLAVREISRFGWSLYSSDLILPYRLRGRYAVDADTRKRAAHAVLFLQTQNDYACPETPESFADDMIGCAWFNGSLAGIAFALIGALMHYGGETETANECLLVGAGIIAFCVLVAWGQNKVHDSFRQEFDTIGDLKIWPFVDNKTLAKANRNNYLLSNFKPDLAT